MFEHEGTMPGTDAHMYRLGLGLATLLMAIQLTEKEPDERRRARKQSVLQEKWAVLRSTFPDELADLQGYGGTGPSVRQLTAAFERATGPWSAARRRALLIDVLMGDPFAPYELKVSVEHAQNAVHSVAVPIGLDDDEITRLWLVWNDALTAYRPSRWRKPDQTSKNIPALTTGELVLPPPRADTTSGGASADALASDHNLALLAGGSLSASDVEMAGGMWLVAPQPEDEPAAAARRLLALELANARTELVKLQMSHALVVQPGLADAVTTGAVIEALGAIHARVAGQLDAERERNDDDAQRIRTLQEMLNAIQLAEEQIERAAAAATASSGTTEDIRRTAPEPAT